MSVEHYIQPVREGDRSFMGWLLEEGFEGKIAKRINRVRKYKSLIHVSDGARSDGRTLDPAILTDEPGEPAPSPPHWRGQPRQTSNCGLSV